MLRTNITGWDAEQLWEAYIQLTQTEMAFRISKNDLKIRPIWHQKEDGYKPISWSVFWRMYYGRCWDNYAIKPVWATNLAMYWMKYLKSKWSTSFCRLDKEPRLQNAVFPSPQKPNKFCSKGSVYICPNI